MDKEKLKQIAYLKTEIESIKKQIEELDGIILVDKVKGSSSCYPYGPRNFTIEGVDSHKTIKLKKKLNRRIDELMDAVEDVNNYIEKIEDSLIRQIISLKYINGLGWKQVAEHIGGNNTEDSVRMICDRFLNKENLLTN